MSYMKYFCPICLVLLFFLSVAQNANSQESTAGVYDKVLSKYSGVKSVTFSFVSKEQPGYKGTVKAKTGNKYIITTGGRSITCSGKTIWNYTKKDNKVVISNYEEAENDELSLEKIFFDFLEQYKAISITKSISSGGPPAWDLVLEPKKKATKVGSMSLSKVVIRIDRNNYSLLSITINDNGVMQTWGLSRIKLNKEYNDSVFNFPIPEGASVVDLR